MTRQRAVAFVRAVLLGLLAGTALASCGYTTRRLEAFPESRTIAVLPFHSGLRRDVDLRLTQAIVREIRARTSLALTTPERADLVLSGDFRLDEVTALQSIDRSPILQRLTGSANVTLRRGGTGNVVKTWRVYHTAEFQPVQPNGLLSPTEPDPAEELGIEEWARRIAVDVVQGLEAGI